jgi:uncharacterized protein (TIGR00369 family)
VDADQPDQASATTHTPETIGRRSERALAVPRLRLLHASLVDRVDGARGIDLSPSANALNAVDALHGGVIATVLDVAAYLAVVPHLTTDEEAVTIAFAAQHIAAARPDEQLRASGSFVRRTRQLAFASAQLRSDSRLLALANVTKAIRGSS